MRARDREREAWFASQAADREQFAEERKQWQRERAQLINALLAKNAGDFSVRQRSSGPEPISAVPREAREPQPQPMGL